MKRIKLSGTNKVNIKAIAEVELNGDFDTYEKLIQTPWGFVQMLIYEEYYFRINSDLSVTVLYEERNGLTEIEIISAGGKEGILGLSFEAEKQALTRLSKRLIKEGFTVVEGNYAGMEKDEKKKLKKEKAEAKQRESESK